MGCTVSLLSEPPASRPEQVPIEGRKPCSRQEQRQQAGPPSGPALARSTSAPEESVKPELAVPTAGGKSLPLADLRPPPAKLGATRMVKSSDSVSTVSTSRPSRCAAVVGKGEYLMGGGSNDFQVAKNMVESDLDVVQRAFSAGVGVNDCEPNARQARRSGRSGSHRKFFDRAASAQNLPSEDVAEEEDQEPKPKISTGSTSGARSTLSFEWSNVLQRCCDEPPSSVPPLRLLTGKALAQLRRFPRSTEREYVTTVSVQNVADIISGSIYFVSHRWDSPEHPDTSGNAKAQLLINWLDREHGTNGWQHMYFWVDWSCIDQDNEELKLQQIHSLSIYLRCCTYFICIAWTDYWSRAWCGMEALAFDMTKKRVVLRSDTGDNDGGVEILANRAAAQAALVRDPLKPHVWDGDCSSDDDRELIMEVMMAVLQVDMKQLENRERAGLGAGRAEAGEGEVAAAAAESGNKDELGDLGALLYAYRRRLRDTTVWVGTCLTLSIQSL